MKFPFEPILGVNVSAVTQHKTLSYVASSIRQWKKTYICVAAVHLIIECQDKPLLRSGVNNAGLVVPDGMPLVWFLKHHNHNVKRVYGPTLMEKVCRLAQQNRFRVFILGGDRGQSIEVKQAVLRRFPSLLIVGNADTPGRRLSSKTNAMLVHRINHSRAQIVFVGMGCPHQELWMIQNRAHLKVNILVGVGAAFSFLTGREKQAPPWMQRTGLEWLFRFTQSPGRLWRRYLVVNARFVLAIIGQLTNKILPTRHSLDDQ